MIKVKKHRPLVGPASYKERVMRERALKAETDRANYSKINCTQPMVDEENEHSESLEVTNTHQISYTIREGVPKAETGGTHHSSPTQVVDQLTDEEHENSKSSIQNHLHKVSYANRERIPEAETEGINYSDPTQVVQGGVGKENEHSEHHALMPFVSPSCTQRVNIGTLRNLTPATRSVATQCEPQVSSVDRMLKNTTVIRNFQHETDGLHYLNADPALKQSQVEENENSETWSLSKRPRHSQDHGTHDAKHHEMVIISLTQKGSVLREETHGTPYPFATYQIGRGSQRAETLRSFYPEHTARYITQLKAPVVGPLILVGWRQQKTIFLDGQIKSRRVSNIT